MKRTGVLLSVLAITLSTPFAGAHEDYESSQNSNEFYTDSYEGGFSSQEYGDDPDSLEAFLNGEYDDMPFTRGLRPEARRIKDYVHRTYGVRNIGGVRADRLCWHPSGRAIDIMVYGNTGLGDRIFNDLRGKARRGEFNVYDLIWKDRWHGRANGYNPGMSIPGHWDHIHVTVGWGSC